MLDWRQLVSERLSGLELDGADREDVCAELAAHLEEDYLCALTAGASEQAALRRALRHVRDWHELQQQIESARKRELPMNKRVSQFWLPAFLTILFAMSTLMLIQLFGPSPVVDPLIWRSNRWRTIAPVAVVYVPWLLMAVDASFYRSNRRLCFRSRRGVSHSHAFIDCFPGPPVPCLFPSRTTYYGNSR